jgi:hypothetical protein
MFWEAISHRNVLRLLNHTSGLYDMVPHPVGLSGWVDTDSDGSLESGSAHSQKKAVDALPGAVY